MAADPTPYSNAEPLALSGEGVVEGEDAVGRRRVCREEDAAVGQLQPGVRAQRRQPDGRVGRERAAGKGLVRGGKERCVGSGVVDIVVVEMRDQHAGVDDDHVGQSSRNRSRYPGSYAPVKAPLVRRIASRRRAVASSWSRSITSRPCSISWSSSSR
jgi:hypothetical protein